MAQNIYDNEEFFAGYSRLPRSVEGLDGAPEWPALGHAAGSARAPVLDLGCGFGWFCRWAREQARPTSRASMCPRNAGARPDRRPPDPAIDYARADMERLALPLAAFDLVYSSLALHYVANLEGLLSEAHQSLVPAAPGVLGGASDLTAPPSRLVRRCRRPQDLAGLNGYLDEGPRRRTG